MPKNVVVTALFVFLPCFVFLAGIPDVIKIDEISDFYKAVIFPHSKHFTVPSSCKACHHRFPEEPARSCYICHKKKDTKTMLSLMKAYHKNCIECHKEMKKGPIKCIDCHKIKNTAVEDFYILNTIPGVYGSVTLSHKGHIKRNIECTTCHHILEEKPKACKACHYSKNLKNRPSLKGAYHRKCLTCHKVKKGCKYCHIKNG